MVEFFGSDAVKTGANLLDEFKNDRSLEINHLLPLQEFILDLPGIAKQFTELMHSEIGKRVSELAYCLASLFFRMEMESSSSAVSVRVSRAAILSWAKRSDSWSSSTVLGMWMVSRLAPFGCIFIGFYARFYPEEGVCSQIYDNCDSSGGYHPG